MLRRWLKAGSRDRWKLFFASDLHGADVCFRKFLNAAHFYGADILVLGGDLTGKAIVPIIADGDRWHLSLRGREAVCRSEEELTAAEKDLRDRGVYALRTDAATADRLRNDPDELDRLQAQMVREQMDRWRCWIDERLGEAGLVVIPGNDDPWVVDDYLEGWGERNIDGCHIEIRGLTLVGLGISNPTPWRSPREFAEDDIAERIERAVDGASGPLVFNIHVPPRDTKLDVCPAVDEQLRPVVRKGEYEMIHAGSTAVREAIARFEPVLSLHGHIHESSGVEAIGRSVAINPGSEYGSGVLRGVVVTMEDGAVYSHQVVTG